ncbi:MAG TPA: IS1 family transposase [Bacteroidetes bacterium]|nr:IS1 family transposase [Bacteroidota bacterium]HEX03673.1 IS1 family transposase [Bacteroidota bacterium]
MNILQIEKQISAIAALTEGCSIRATERLTGIHRDTIMRLGVRVGQGCAKLHNALMRDLHVDLIEVDEIWSYVGKKQRKLTKEDGTDKGDQYTFTALDATSKAMIAYRVGKRDGDNTRAFAWDLRERITNVPMISSDAFPPYVQAIKDAFGDEVHYGQIVKKYAGEPGKDSARRYSPGYVVAVERRAVHGKPVRFLTSTSYVERSNLTFRMQQRRFTRLTNGFSKKLKNHKAAVALFIAHYNFCRVHETIRVTPAMQLGVADHIWTIGELVEAALHGSINEPEGKRVGPFRVIDGGVS